MNWISLCCTSGIYRKRCIDLSRLVPGKYEIRGRSVIHIIILCAGNNIRIKLAADNVAGIIKCEGLSTRVEIVLRHLSATC